MPEPETASTLDDETTAALTLFNEYVEADRERTQREKRVKKAERAKDEAAAAVKKLGDRGSGEERAAAEAAYREAADRWKKLRDGEDPDAGSEAAASADAAPPVETGTAAADQTGETGETDQPDQPDQTGTAAADQPDDEDPAPAQG